ncbi:winged helix-turn-helix domain-containing protein [Streptomyces uncialis]|uniref:winged helix-turn-helix domain-containing protein n=1 Tax=Streptomyces uncialis TaxID=1048205 RepID=UPI0037F9EBA2
MPAEAAAGLAERPPCQGGDAALVTKGPGGLPRRLDDVRAELEAGRRGTDGSEDQRWTLARVAAQIHRLFGCRYTSHRASYLLHRPC